MNHCLVFDIGKTNKKCFVFDEDYRIVFEKTAQFPETTDDDGFPCEDLALLKNWIQETAGDLLRHPDFQIKAVNCTTYGASFVHLDADFQPVAPVYNYLKPFPEDLRNRFLEQYGPVEKISLETASPFLGYLNSGLQLYGLKYHKPLIFNKIKYSLHLPQWVANVGRVLNPSDVKTNPSDVKTEMTSLGCHTMLWDFRKNDYHDWVKKEGLVEKFPPIAQTATGLHDSSAALIPYLATMQEPFVLISTGTWCISLNPFNTEPLTPEELAQDCLCYLTREGRPVKAARYFGGHEHEQAVKNIAREYGVEDDFYLSIQQTEGDAPATGDFGNFLNFRNLNTPIRKAQAAYAQIMQQLAAKQVASTRLALGNSSVRRIFVDGGFSGNRLYMRLLAAAFPQMEVFAAEVAQATALGAALAVHAGWNTRAVPSHLISLKNT